MQETQETRVRSLGGEDALAKDMAAHSSILTSEHHGQRSLAGCSPQGRTESGLKRLGTQHKAGRELEKDVEKVCFSDETVVCVQDGSVERCRSEGMVGGATPDPRGWTWA